MANKKMSSDLILLEMLAKKAGEIGLKYFKSQNEVWYKNGSSPVSQADKEIDEFLLNAFAAERPDYGWLSEETEDDKDRLNKDIVVIADPIDGTRGFIAGRDEWCISIAIVKDSRPIHAVLHCPAMNRTFLATKGAGLDIQEETKTKPRSDQKHIVTGSKKIIELLNDHAEKNVEVMDFIPSLAYRLALVASGELTGAFARQGASEWDVAAADLILEEANCKLATKLGEQVRYNSRNVIVPSLVAAHESEYENILALANRAAILK